MIDFTAREAHFVDHLAPVWHALPAELRGRFHVAVAVAGHARRLGLDPVVGWPAPGAGPVVAAAWADLRGVAHLGRPVVFFEHGAGQSYGHNGNRHPSYSGGRGRDQVALFVVPNEYAAARNRRFYPTVDNAVVGSARVDELRRVGRRPGPPTAAVSWHFRCRVSPEAYTAFDHYRDTLAATTATLADQGVTLIGHGHPRIIDEVAPVYDQAGIETVRSFDEVVARADVLAVDNSSVLFEFAACGRPVVPVNSPRWRRRVRHGLRFWDEAGVGLNVDRADTLAATILRALDDPPEVRAAREATVRRVYPGGGDAAERAAAAVAGTVAVEAVA